MDNIHNDFLLSELSINEDEVLFKICDELYEKIINGDEINGDYYSKSEYLKKINKYFTENHKTTPLLLALRHSHFESNIKYLFYLFGKNIYFDVHYRNSYGNSIFDMMPYLINNINLLLNNLSNYDELAQRLEEILKKKKCLNIWKKDLYNKYLKQIFKKFSSEINNFALTNNDGNTIYMNVLLSKNKNYIALMLSCLVSLICNIETNSHQKLFNIFQINHNDETFLDILSKLKFNKEELIVSSAMQKFVLINFKKIILDALYYLYYSGYKYYEYKSFDEFLRINKNGETPLINFCKNNKLHLIANFSGYNSMYKCSLAKNIDYIDNNNNTALIYALKRNSSKKSLNFFQNSNNKSHINNKNETAFYLACKKGYLGFVSDIYEKNLTNSDIYPKNKPSAIYYLLEKQGKEEEKDYLNKQCNLAYIITKKSDRIKFNKLLNYGENKKLFSEKSQNYDIKDLIDKWNPNNQSYNFLHKKIYNLRYKPFLIENNVLSLDLITEIRKLLFND